MFLFFDFPNSTLGELAGARVGSQGKQRTGPRPCNNIKVLIQRKIWKVNKKYQTKSANRSSTLQFSSELPNAFFTSQKAMKISPKKTANRSTALQFSIKSQSCFFIKITFMFFSDQIFIHYWKGDQPASPHGSLLDVSGVGDAGYELIFFLC